MQKEQTSVAEITRTRPKLPEEYNVPTGEEGLLEWDWVVERLEKALNYWVGTTGLDGRPHVVPVWATWFDDTLYFDGHPQTRWGRNMQHNPSVVIHLESGDEVVILEGVVQDIAHLDPAVAEKLGEKYKAKYSPQPDISVDTEIKAWIERGLYAVRPQVAIAWKEFPSSMTRWRFPQLA